MPYLLIIFGVMLTSKIDSPSIASSSANQFIGGMGAFAIFVLSDGSALSILDKSIFRWLGTDLGGISLLMDSLKSANPTASCCLISI